MAISATTNHFAYCDCCFCFTVVLVAAAAVVAAVTSPAPAGSVYASVDAVVVAAAAS